MFFKKFFLFILLQSFLFSFVLGIDIVFQRRTYRFRSWMSIMFLSPISSSSPFLYRNFIQHSILVNVLIFSHLTYIWSTQHVITTAVTFSMRLSRLFKRQRQRAFRIPNAPSTVAPALDNFLLNFFSCLVSAGPY